MGRGKNGTAGRRSSRRPPETLLRRLAEELRPHVRAAIEPHGDRLFRKLIDLATEERKDLWRTFRRIGLRKTVLAAIWMPQYGVLWAMSLLHLYAHLRPAAARARMLDDLSRKYAERLADLCGSFSVEKASEPPASSEGFRDRLAREAFFPEDQAFLVEALRRCAAAKIPYDRLAAAVTSSPV